MNTRVEEVFDSALAACEASPTPANIAALRRAHHAARKEIVADMAPLIQLVELMAEQTRRAILRGKAGKCFNRDAS